MTDTTYEEARRCPKCTFPGDLIKKTLAPQTATRGAQLHHFRCMNERCKWFEEICRIVQVNPDGSIPPPLTKRDKQFPAVPDLSKQVNESLERQLAAELSGGAELNR